MTQTGRGPVSEHHLGVGLHWTGTYLYCQAKWDSETQHNRRYPANPWISIKGSATNGNLCPSEGMRPIPCRQITISWLEYHSRSFSTFLITFWCSWSNNYMNQGEFQNVQFRTDFRDYGKNAITNLRLIHIDRATTSLKENEKLHKSCARQLWKVEAHLTIAPFPFSVCFPATLWWKFDSQKMRETHVWSLQTNRLATGLLLTTTVLTRTQYSLRKSQKA